MLFVASVVSLLSVCFACSPEGDANLPRAEDLVGKTYYSHAVVIGRAVMIYPTPELSHNAYTVNLQVSSLFEVPYKSRDKNAMYPQRVKVSMLIHTCPHRPLVNINP